MTLFISAIDVLVDLLIIYFLSINEIDHNLYIFRKKVNFPLIFFLIFKIHNSFHRAIIQLLVSVPLVAKYSN